HLDACRLEKAADWAPASEEPQQQQAGRDRRNDQRQRHERLDDGLARKAPAGEQPRECDPRHEHHRRRGQRGKDREDRDLADLGSHFSVRNPARVKISRASAVCRNASRRMAPCGFVPVRMAAAGYTIFGPSEAGTTKARRTRCAVAMSVRYTMAASAAPFSTAARASRTLPDGTIFDSTSAHMPICCRYAFA